MSQITVTTSTTFNADKVTFTNGATRITGTEWLTLDTMEQYAWTIVKTGQPEYSEVEHVQAV